MRGLPGRVGLVTGGGRGIGRATADRLVQEGAKVVICDIDEDVAKAAADDLGPDHAVGIAADISTVEGAHLAVEMATTTFGSLDLVHNNAGNISPARPLPDIEPEEFDAVLRVHVRGCFLVLREALGVMRAQGTGGAIVNTSSVAGVRGAPMRAPYSASKHAIVGLTRVAAIDMAGTGIRINAICPGPIRTRFIEPTAREWGDGSVEASLDARAAPVPLKRLGTPDEVAALVCWLLSDEASYVNGGLYTVDGGRHAR